jgi:ABC-type branched-subunit amino acid transport system ATPase component
VTALLQVEDLAKAFGPMRAVGGASFTVETGTITGLIGPNGAGKTTTFDLVSGRVRPDGGSVAFAGADVTGMQAHRLAAAGLVRTFQIPRAFHRMTVWENLLFAGTDHPGEGFLAGVLSTPASRRREREIEERANEVLEFLEINHVTDLPASSLSGGQRKLLELARALMRSPKLILLDEPFAGVAPALTAKIAGKLADLRGEGMTILLVEHDLETVMRLVDKLVVMHLGSVLVTGDPATVRSDARVLEAYLGGTHV